MKFVTYVPWMIYVFQVTELSYRIEPDVDDDILKIYTQEDGWEYLLSISRSGLCTDELEINRNVCWDIENMNIYDYICAYACLGSK